jgi:RNA polymerase sigma-70 factor (ECF subfamily)
MSALPESFEAHRSAVYGWALRILGSRADAQDVTQDVGLRWLQRGSDGQLDNARAWLRRVTVNRALDVVRQRRTMSQLAAKVGHQSAERVVDGTALEQAELRAAVNAALAQLSDAQRDVLCAKVFDGMTFAQVAQQMRIAIPTAKTHYLRAVAAMAQHLGPFVQMGDDKP